MKNGILHFIIATCFCNADLPAYNLNWGPKGCESDGIKTRRLYEPKQTYGVPKHVYKFMKNVKSKSLIITNSLK